MILNAPFFDRQAESLESSSSFAEKLVKKLCKEAAREMVKEVVNKHFPAGSDECKRLFPLGKAYHEPGFFEGNVEMWRALKAAAYAARSAKKGEHGFWESSLGDLLSLGG